MSTTSEEATPPAPRLIPFFQADPVNDDDREREESPLPEELLAALDRAAAGEPAALERWRAAHPDRRAELDALEQLWRASRAPAAAPDWPELSRRLDGAESRRVIVLRPPTHAALGRWRPLGRVAAVLLLGLALGRLGPLLLRRPAAPSEPTVISVPAGAMAKLRLPGGILVHLNAASTLRYRAVAGGITDVRLEGEAYFDVPHDSAREFVVHTGAGIVRDLGTAFDVRAREGRLRVDVAEGTVELEAAHAAVTVAAGEESTVAAGQPPRVPIPADVRAASAWTEGTLVFIDEPLEEVAAEVGRHFGVPFRAAPAVRGRRITATIRTRRSSDAARAICAALGARCQDRDGGWLISARP